MPIKYWLIDWLIDWFIHSYLVEIFNYWIYYIRSVITTELTKMLPSKQQTLLVYAT